MCDCEYSVLISYMLSNQIVSSKLCVSYILKFHRQRASNPVSYGLIDMSLLSRCQDHMVLACSIFSMNISFSVN